MYLLHLSRYIHLNPVVAGLVDKPAEWPYSSYAAYLGLRRDSVVHPELVLSQFARTEEAGPSGQAAATAYKEFVEETGSQDNAFIGQFTVDE
jgi:hypothetical protein